MDNENKFVEKVGILCTASATVSRLVASLLVALKVKKERGKDIRGL